MHLENYGCLFERLCYSTTGEVPVGMLRTEEVEKVCFTEEVYSSFHSIFIATCAFYLYVKNHPYWTSRKNRSELIELSSINKVSLV